MPSVSSFNWEHGSWSAPDAGEPTATVLVSGDWAPIRHFRSLIETSPQDVYGDLLPEIRTADLSVVNLEAPLSNRGVAVNKSGSVFKGDEKHVAGLAAVPFDVVTLANNHVFDFGMDAFQDTLRVLEANNIQHTGAGFSEKDAATPLVVNANGIRIGIVNFSEGEDLTAAVGDCPGVMGWDLSTVVETVARLKKSTHAVVAIGHCGIEYIPFPPPYVSEAFQQIADAGADVVLGHHPHVPQGLSFQNGVPICHSLGNFAFYQETNLAYRKLGYMVRLGFTKDTLVSLKLIPYHIRDDGLAALGGRDLERFLTTFKDISLPLNDPQRFNQTWDAFLHHYGVDGFTSEVGRLLKTMEADPQKGAAMFRNRLTTLQHYHHWKDFLTRMVDGTPESPPDWATRLTEEWLTATI